MASQPSLAASAAVPERAHGVERDLHEPDHDRETPRERAVVGGWGYRHACPCRRAGSRSTTGTHTDEPTSAQRVRAVPVEAIHPGTLALLATLHASQAADRLRAGSAYRESGYVVVDALGAPPVPAVYSDRFRRLCIAAGVPVITLHSVRHSLAFWLHQLGVAPADAAALLGHNVEVHLATYLPHSGAAGIGAAAAALGRAGLATV